MSWLNQDECFIGFSVMSNFIVASYYTIDTPYEREVQRLATSLIHHKLEFDIQGYKSKGSWIANVGLKPIFIFDMLLKHNKDVLFLDADAVVQQSLSLFRDFDADIGVHYKDGRELLSGTIFVKNSSKAKKVIEDWCVEQRQNPDTWDQKNLARVLLRSDVDVYNLPESYTHIFDLPGEAVIQHNQASRRFKRRVG